MDMKKLNTTTKTVVSGMMMALYIAIMALTQSFAFGQYQVRIATALYAAAYLFPFLVVPLGLSNLLSNLIMGGLGGLDIIGGGIVGLLTAGCCALIGRYGWNEELTAIPIALIPALGASGWLAPLLRLPYWPLAVSLLVGQTICGITGAALIKGLKRIWKKEGYSNERQNKQ